MLMAAFSEHFQMISHHFEQTFDGRVYVCEKPTFWAGGGILSDEKLKAIRLLPEVATAIPLLIGRLEANRLVVIGIPQVVVGVPPAQARFLWRDAPLADGRWLQADDAHSDRAMLGSEVAYALNAKAGSRVHVLDCDFEVIGVVASTGSLEDRQMLVSLDTAQKVMDRAGILTSIVTTPHSPALSESLASAIRRGVHGVEALPPSRMRLEAAQSLRLWEAMTLGTGLIAALTGSMSIVITMIVSMHERTREIGVKKAVGASNGQIAREFVIEAAILAVLGWIVGLALALLFVGAWDQWFRQEGIFLFRVTWRLVLASGFVALSLGVIAGLLPALAAARLDPVRALRGSP